MSQNSKLTGQLSQAEKVVSLSFFSWGNCSSPDHHSALRLNSVQFTDGFPELGSTELDTASRCGLVRNEYREIVNTLLLLMGRAHTVQGAICPYESTNKSNTKLERPYFMVTLRLCVYIIVK